MPAARAADHAAQTETTVVTRLVVPGTPERVWERLAFYEQVDTRPPLLLRLVLPTPYRTDPKLQGVGSEVRCRYRGGHLVKRITRIEPARLYAFTVVEQDLRVGGVRLCGGWYALRALPGGRTELEAGSRYESSRRPAWLFRPIERHVCHAFHRHVLRAVAG